MRHDSQSWILSPTDLSEFLSCRHLTNMKVRRAKGERSAWPTNDSPHTAIVQRRGDEHEEAMIARLESEVGVPAFELSPEDGAWPRTFGEMSAATARTLAAMKQGHALITQAALFDPEDAWFGSGDPDEEPDDGSEGAAHRFGFVDVLRRVEVPSSVLGGYSYEVVEIKLARQPKPKFVHQISIYSRALGRLQGVEPECGYLLLGDGSEIEIQLNRYSAAHAHVERQLRDFVESPPEPDAVPEPVEHCQLCPLSGECHELRVRADHLSLVANLASAPRKALMAAGIETLEALATANGEAPQDVSAPVWEKARRQAWLQSESRRLGEPTRRNLTPEPGLGYAKLPEPDPADLFFDLEGDPYEGETGIEFLWGWSDAVDDYDCTWAHDEDEEKRALERFVDLVHARWVANPGMHVYHYAPHERTKLKALAQKYATREREVDDLLRGLVIVDLYEVVRQALQVGEEGYSLKQLERHHGFERTEKTVRGGGGAIVAYETFLTTEDEAESKAQLKAIADYNREDCVSTRSLRDWLWDIVRPEALKEWPDADFDFGPAPDPDEVSEPDEFADSIALAERLRESVDIEGMEQEEVDARMLLSHLLLYHRREDKVYWWRFFELDGMTSDELVDEIDAIGGLARNHSVEPWPVTNRSHGFEFTVPAQTSKIKSSSAVRVLDHPGTEAGGSVSSIELRRDRPGRVVMKKSHKGGVVEVAPNPRGIIEGDVPTGALRQAINEVADDLLTGNERFAAALALLRHEGPRSADGEPLRLEPEALVEDALALGRSVLPVQGPPGTGKTHNGAKMIVEALRAGRRVGVTAPNHKAIMNLLRAVEERAFDEGFLFKGAYAQGGSSEAWIGPHGFIEGVKSGNNSRAFAADVRLIAGTAWLFSGRGDTTNATETVDLLFIDEAGQYPLANAIAASTATRGGMVLLGDPQQLPQVSQATHPDGAERSVLEHLFGDRDTVADDSGVLLDVTWRLHPAICEFNSWLSYDGRLRSRDDCAERSIKATGRLAGAGLRFVPIDHDGCQQASREEAEMVASLCRELLDGGATVTGPIGEGRALEERPLRPDDIMIVAPYNLAVQEIADAVPDGVAVGTVDKFQGQEAPVVIYAMTCSSAEEAPRGMAFLFDDHRLNVATSRAQCLAVVVANPRLFDAQAKSLEQLELVNGLCRFAAMAEKVNP